MFGITPFGVQSSVFGGLPIFYAAPSFSLATSMRAAYKIYAATHEYATRPTDALSNIPFFGTLQTSMRIDRSVAGGDDYGGVSVGAGEIDLINTDGSYDDVARHFSIDGCPVVLRAVLWGDSYDNAVVVFSGTAAGWNSNEDVLRVRLRDPDYKLDVSAQPNLYGGTGGADGGDDLAQKRKPRAFGPCNNIAPPLVSASLLIYQVNDGPVQAIGAIYDNGVALTAGSDYASYTLLAAATVAAGTFATCLAEGYVRLGANPAGAVTADIQGDKTGGTYVATTTTIVRRLLAAAVADPDDLFIPSFDSLDAAQPAVVGYYMDENASLTVRAAVDDLLGGIYGYLIPRFDGTFEIGRIEGPGGAPMARYARSDVIEVAREELPAGLNPMPWRYRVEYGRSWTVQADLPDSVGAARKAYVGQAARTVASSNTVLGARIKASHPLAQDPDPRRAFFDEQTDAQAEADRLLTLWGAMTRYAYRISLPREGLFRHKIGESIRLDYPRVDLDGGKDLRIVAISADTNTMKCEVLTFG